VSIFKVPKKSREEKLAKPSAVQRAELDRIEAEAIASFHGDLPELESALGMLRMGHHFGWKVLYIIHSKKTIRKYEQILTGDSKEPVRIRELFKEDGPSSYRSHGYRLVQAASNFWRAISGEAEDVKLEKEVRRAVEK
jgi:hypothetical protein